MPADIPVSTSTPTPTKTPTKTPNTINEWADFWRYSIGVNVIPANTKEKRTWVEWTQWQDSPIPKETHEAWQKSNSFRNGMAVIVGKVHHNEQKKDLYLFCIDCDNQKAVNEFFPNGLDYVQVNTLVEWHDDDTSKLHMYGYTTYPLPKKSSDKTNQSLTDKLSANEIPAVEVKGKGKDGIMFCSPSVHKNGYQYHTGKCLEPSISDNIEKAIDEVCHKYGIVYLTGTKDGNNKIDIMDLMGNKIVIYEGHNRHEAILRVAEHYAATVPGVNVEDLIIITKKRNDAICKPPLAEGEIRKLCEQAIPYVAKTIGLPKVREGLNTNKRTESKKIEFVIIAQRILEEHHFLTLAITHEVLVFNDGVYKYGGEETISQEARSIATDITSHEISEIIKYIQDKTGYHTVDEFDNDYTQINVRNGIVDIKTGGLSEHDYTILSRIQLPVIYNKSILPKKFFKYLASAHSDGSVIKTVVEMMALCLIRNAQFHKAFVNTGQGSNGKTVLLNMLTAVLGKDNISTQTIQSLQHNRFATASLDGKLANIAGDIDPDALKGTGRLKDIIGGGILSAEKKFKGAYNFTNFATLIFSANQIPEVSDTSDGFARRFIIIQWTKQFLSSRKKKNDEIPSGNIVYNEDHSLKMMHLDEDEISGVFNIMLTAARMLMRNNTLTHEPKIDEIKQLWREKASSIEAFMAKEMLWGANEECTINDVYTRYVKYCQRGKRAIKDQSAISKALKSKGCTPQKTRIRNEQVTKWTGCIPTDMFDAKLDSTQSRLS